MKSKILDEDIRQALVPLISKYGYDEVSKAATGLLEGADQVMMTGRLHAIRVRIMKNIADAMENGLGGYL